MFQLCIHMYVPPACRLRYGHQRHPLATHKDYVTFAKLMNIAAS